MERVVVEISDEMAHELCEYFHTDDLCKIVKILIDEGGVPLVFGGFGDSIQVKPYLESEE